jgi:2,3-bisphosphoglycerate-dependent phosphoglycerate mutase
MIPSIASIVLVRHARSIANDDPAIYKVMADHVIPLARPDDDAAALDAGRALAALGLDPAETCSWCSTYLRCAQTEALVLNQAFGIDAGRVLRRPSFLLREQDFGDWDSPTEGEMAAADPERYARRRRLSDALGRFYFRYPNGESRADVTLRIATFIGKMHRSRYPHHLVFLHGVTQRAFRMAWLNRSVEWFETEPNPGNAQVVIIARDRGGAWADRVLEPRP